MVTAALVSGLCPVGWPMETSAAEQRQLRAALDAALATTFDFGIRKLKAPRWQPSPGSEASAELASVQVRQDGQSWGDDVLRTPYATASLLMTGVLDNLGSIRQLIDDPYAGDRPDSDRPVGDGDRRYRLVAHGTGDWRPPPDMPSARPEPDQRAPGGANRRGTARQRSKKGGHGPGRQSPRTDKRPRHRSADGNSV